MNNENIQTIPDATIVPTRSLSKWIAWLIPLIALTVVAFLYIEYQQQAGILINIQFDEGYGIKAGDALRCKGIEVGRIEKIALSKDLKAINVSARLSASATHLARTGTQFWIERPQFSIEGISGLETITGKRYIAILPVDDTRNTQRQFTGLNNPPVLATEPPGGLEITLYAKVRGSLRAGAPILFRQTRVGTVISVGLSPDAATVEAQAYIRPGFTSLVRDNTVFWNASGADFQASFREGFRFKLESLQTLIAGGVGLATPTNPGSTVSTGQRFTLHPRVEEDWLTWQPAIPLGSAWLPEGLAPPQLNFATVTHKNKGFFNRSQRISGWLLQLPNGIIGPNDLLTTNQDTDAPVSVLEFTGKQILLNQPTTQLSPHITLLNFKIDNLPTWPEIRIRTPDLPEDCLLFTGGAMTPRAVAAVHLTAKDGESHWTVQPHITFEQALHGAAVIARNDGKLIGLLIVKDGQGRISLITNPEPTPAK